MGVTPNPEQPTRKASTWFRLPNRIKNLNRHVKTKPKEEPEEDPIDTQKIKHAGELSAGFANCYNNAKFSDLIIKSETCQFKAHKLVVCAQSDYFNRMFNGNGEWVETINNAVSLKEDEPWAMEAMLRFMYGLSYDGNNGGRRCCPEDISPMLLSIKQYGIADKYGVVRLKEHAKQQFNAISKTGWKTEDFLASVTEAYANTPEGDSGLLDSFIEVSFKHLDELIDKTSYKQLLQDTERYATDLVLYLAQQKTVAPALTEHACPTCRVGKLLEIPQQGSLSRIFVCVSCLKGCWVNPELKDGLVACA